MGTFIRHLWQCYLELTPKQLLIAYVITVILMNLTFSGLYIALLASFHVKILAFLQNIAQDPELSTHLYWGMCLFSLPPQVFIIRLFFLSKTTLEVIQ